MRRNGVIGNDFRIPGWRIETWEESRINEKKEILAYELTALVHGKEEAEKAQEASHALFRGEGDDTHMPETALSSGEVPEEGLRILDLLSACGLIASRSEGRRLIEQGGIHVDGEKIVSHESLIGRQALENGVKIRKGKKVYHRAIIRLSDNEK